MKAYKVWSRSLPAAEVVRADSWDRPGECVATFYRNTDDGGGREIVGHFTDVIAVILLSEPAPATTQNAKEAA